jgi:hypothetical protein
MAERLLLQDYLRRAGGDKAAAFVLFEKERLKLTNAAEGFVLVFPCVFTLLLMSPPMGPVTGLGIGVVWLAITWDAIKTDGERAARLLDEINV